MPLTSDYGHWTSAGRVIPYKWRWLSFPVLYFNSTLLATLLLYTWVCFTLLDSTHFYSGLVYFVLICSTLPHSILLYAYTNLPHSVLMHSNFLSSTPSHFTSFHPAPSTPPHPTPPHPTPSGQIFWPSWKVCLSRPVIHVQRFVKNYFTFFFFFSFLIHIFSASFWRKLTFVHSLRILSSHIPVDYIYIPDEVMR